MVRPRPPLLRRLQPLVWLVLLITGLGLSRWAVQCTKPCCAGHVKLVASCDSLAPRPATTTNCSCCSRAHAPGHSQNQRHHRERAPAPHSDPSDCGGCEHIRLGVELAENPPPARPLALPGTAVTDHREAPPWLPPSAPRPAHHPSATGPPPHAVRCAHRTTIQLLC
jgi:hypothetical protein